MPPLFNPSSGGAASSVTTGGFLPAESNFIGWSFDPADTQAGAGVSAAGALQLVRVKIPASVTVTNIVLHVAAAGVTLTSGQNFAGLYSGAGVLLGAGAVTADQSTAWQSTGVKTMPLTVAQAATGPYVYVGWFANASGSTPSFARASSFSPGLINTGLTAPNLRFATADTGLTTALPGSIGAQTAATSAFWVGLI